MAIKRNGFCIHHCLTAPEGNYWGKTKWPLTLKLCKEENKWVWYSIQLSFRRYHSSQYNLWDEIFSMCSLLFRDENVGYLNICPTIPWDRWINGWLKPDEFMWVASIALYNGSWLQKTIIYSVVGYMYSECLHRSRHQILG